jgi:hypothetical protein
MAQLDEAAKRLQGALDRLERIIESRPAGGGSDSDLRKAVKAARDENKALQKVADNVTKRLDATIDRLQATLEN